jgi:8-oxo-dGTP diphosphatase
MSDTVVHVVAAAIFNDQGQVLLARRPAHVHQGGLWEFPGGKLEPGETVTGALVRELDEELGIMPAGQRPLLRIRHDYPDKSVLLDVWRIDAFRSTNAANHSELKQLTGREGQPLCWVAPDALAAYAFPAANRAIVHALRLPSRYLITPESGDDAGAFLNTLRQALAQGMKLVRLRAGHLDRSAYTDLAQQVQTLCHDVQASLLLSGDDVGFVADSVTAVGADGLHLSSRQLLGLSQRPVADDVWLAASCHDSREIEQACALGVDFITVSPLLPTRSHPQARPLGWAQFQSLVEQASMPVYGLGGLNAAHIERVWRCGGQGIAAISSLWGQRMDQKTSPSRQ